MSDLSFPSPRLLNQPDLHAPLLPEAAPMRADADELMADQPILLIDDEPMLTDVVQAYLEDAGYRQLTAVNDPAVALREIWRLRPSLLLLDLVMPGVSGFDILKAIRQHPELRYTPVIVLTAASDPATKLRALEMGATEFLAKPVDASELALRVRNSLVVKVYQDRLANTDPVTGLPNRRVFLERLQAGLVESIAQGHPLALLQLRLDRFQQMHAALGHAATDELLRTVAQRIGVSMRRGEDENTQPRVGPTPIARLDSDTFAVLLPKVDSPEVAAQVARKMLKALAEPLRVGDADVSVSPCIGIAMAPTDGTTPDAMFVSASSAVAQASAMGRSSFQFGSPQFNAALVERLRLEAQLHRAAEQGQLALAFQPKIDARTGRITAAEALLRWNHPQQGPISPARFVPIAEESGLIVQLGAWAIDRACAQIASWTSQGLLGMTVAVNVTRKELLGGALVDTVTAALKRHGVPPAQLSLELTESSLVDDIELARAQLGALRELGLKVAIDDFGTGYSSMSYLKNFPFDELKVDRSFVMNLPDDRTDRAISQAMIVLGHSLGMRVVAEGVETVAQILALQEMGVDIFQGYLTGKPQPGSQFPRLVQEFRLSSLTEPRAAVV